MPSEPLEAIIYLGLVVQYLGLVVQPLALLATARDQPDSIRRAAIEEFVEPTPLAS